MIINNMMTEYTVLNLSVCMSVDIHVSYLLLRDHDELKANINYSQGFEELAITPKMSNLN